MKHALLLSILASAILVTGSAAPENPTRAAPSGEPAAGAGEKPLDAEPLPSEKTPLPTSAEWSAAGRVKLTRIGPAAADCRAYRVREWLRVRCPKLTTASMSLLGGTQEGLVFWIDPPKEKTSEMPGGGEVMFPLRRGDRRVIQISTFGQGYDGPFTILPAVIIQEQWVDGDPAPIVTAM